MRLAHAVPNNILVAAMVSQSRNLLVQVPTATSISGPSTAFAGDSAFGVTVNVTFPPGTLLQPFSDPGAAARGTVSLTNTADGTAVSGAGNVSMSGPGFVTFSFNPSQPFGLGPHSVLAKYASSAAYLLGSSAHSAYTFTVVQVRSQADVTQTLGLLADALYDASDAILSNPCEYRAALAHALKK